MPYYNNRRYGRRRYIRRRRPYRKQPGVIQMAKKAYYGYRMLKGIVNSEKKTYDASFPSPQSSTATVTPLTGIAQGDDYNAREGRSILLKSIQVQGNIGQNNSATATLYRWIVFIDNDNTGSAPTAAQLGITSVNSLRDPNPVNMKRFSILCDRLIRMDDGSNQNFPIKWFHKLNHHAKFDGTTANDYAQGSVWLLTVSDQAINTPSITATSRVRYYDN